MGAIPLMKEPPDFGACEMCCFCHQPTRWWTDLPDRTPGNQVACCPDCAGTFPADVVPSKREWCEYWDATMRASGVVMP